VESLSFFYIPNFIYSVYLDRYMTMPRIFKTKNRWMQVLKEGMDEIEEHFDDSAYLMSRKEFEGYVSGILLSIEAHEEVG
jgi:hypothetical protein